MIFEKIYNLNSFQKQYKKLLILSACQQIPNLNWYTDKDLILEGICWENMLEIASAFSYSDDRKYIDVALRIAQTCLEQDSCTVLQKSACEVILNNLTNFQAIELAYKRHYLNNNQNVSKSFGLALQELKNEVSNTVFIQDKYYLLNRFQKEVYDKGSIAQALTISSSTSAGKSFVLSRIILKILEISTDCNVAYIVPSRALISQVLHDLTQEVNSHQLIVNLITIPPQKKEKVPKGLNIFIFTQERLHWFLSEHIDFSFNYLFVDEAQEIQSGSRGVLLQKIVERVVHSNPKVKVYFSSPLAKNPEVLLTLLPPSFSQEVVNKEYVAVNQNLILVQKSLSEHKCKIWDFELLTEFGPLKLGSVKREISSDSKVEILSSLCSSLSSSETNAMGNIIYANGQSEAEKIGKKIAETLPEKESPQLETLIELIKNLIHPQYVLIQLLKKGVAFHYANIPLVIRERILQLFASGEILYLICTSTLLEGVNTPAKSLFLYNPTKGKGISLNQMDFWNLVGRAGRLGKEFSGNIYCVQLNKWKEKPSLSRKKYQIRPSMNEFLRNIEKLNEDDVDIVLNNSRDENSQAITYLYEKYIINGSSCEKESAAIKAIVKKMQSLSKNIIVPVNILKRNPAFTPDEQQTLFDYFEKLTGLQAIEKYVPCNPVDERAYITYKRIIQVLDETLLRNRKRKLTPEKTAIFAISWMKGKPLRLIIERQLKFAKERQSHKKLDTLIRETLSYIETEVRYIFLQAVSCYIDILREFLSKKNNSNIEFPDVVTWLEFGISKETELNFLRMGFNRYSAIELSNCAGNEPLQSREQIIKYLRGVLINNQTKVPQLVKEEIKLILGDDLEKAEPDACRIHK